MVDLDLGQAQAGFHLVALHLTWISARRRPGSTSSPSTTATVFLPSSRITACPRLPPEAAITPVRRTALALESGCALPKRPAADEESGDVCVTTGARAAAAGASQAQLQYASTTPSSEAADRFARNPILFKTYAAPRRG